jgi:hypothetical protein
MLDVRKRPSVRILHARPGVADLLAHDPCKTQSLNQIGVLEYVTGFERVVERSMFLIRPTISQLVERTSAAVSLAEAAD